MVKIITTFTTIAFLTGCFSDPFEERERMWEKARQNAVLELRGADAIVVNWIDSNLTENFESAINDILKLLKPSNN